MTAVVWVTAVGGWLNHGLLLVKNCFLVTRLKLSGFWGGVSIVRRWEWLNPKGFLEPLGFLEWENPKGWGKPLGLGGEL